MGSLSESADAKFVQSAQKTEEGRREQQERSQIATHSKRGREKED